jgi:hypothetical protein
VEARDVTERPARRARPADPSAPLRLLGRWAGLCAVVLSGAAAAARGPAAHEALRGQEPSHWFATRAGLIRVYQEKRRPGAPKASEGAPPAGASCEVVESTPRDGETPARTRESCTMISGRRARAASQLTYELRAAGIFMVRAETEGQKAATMDKLLLPKVLAGRSWSEARAGHTVVRTVKSAGSACRAAGRSFGDCLVLKAVEQDGKKTVRGWSETYAAGVGLVEDAQWELIDVKGL